MRRQGKGLPARNKTDSTQVAASATLATWGLPDWREPAAYGDTKRWTVMRWRWEFTRRRDDYRAEAMALMDILEARKTAAAQFRRTQAEKARNRLSIVADQQQHAWETFWQRWGYIELLDPRISDYPDDDLKTQPHDGFNVMEGSPSSETGQSAMRPKIGQMAICFDLDKPIAEQIKLASETLKRRQEKRHGKCLQQRRHPGKWLGYLRTLDAREAGASWSEIATLHPRTAQTEQTARDIWEQARALCFNF